MLETFILLKCIKVHYFQSLFSHSFIVIPHPHLLFISSVSHLILFLCCSGKNTLSSLPQLVSSHSSAFTPVSKSLTHDAPPSQDAATKPPTRSRSLSPTLRQTSLHSLRNSKFQSPARVVYSKSVSSSSPKPTPGSAKATPGSANGTALNSGKSSVPQSGFQRNTPMRRSGPARVRNVEGNGLVSTLKKSSDPQSKYKSV